MKPSISASDLSSLPQIARQSVLDSLSGKMAASLRAEGDMKQSRGLFVTINTADQRLRGCRGTVTASYGDLIEETRSNAQAAAFHDPRFPSVTLDEIHDLKFEVSVLGDVEDVPDESGLDAQIYGIIITSMDEQKRALMLPGIPDLDTVEKQIFATCVKAGLEDGEPIQLQRFQVEKFCD